MPQSKRRKPKNVTATKSRTHNPEIYGQEPSPKWYVLTMSALMIVGVLLILGRFIFPRVFEYWSVAAGLGMIAVGFMMTTNLR